MTSDYILRVSSLNTSCNSMLTLKKKNFQNKNNQTSKFFHLFLYCLSLCLFFIEVRTFMIFFLKMYVFFKKKITINFSLLKSLNFILFSFFFSHKILMVNGLNICIFERFYRRGEGFTMVDLDFFLFDTFR